MVNDRVSCESKEGTFWALRCAIPRMMPTLVGCECASLEQPLNIAIEIIAWCEAIPEIRGAFLDIQKHLFELRDH